MGDQAADLLRDMAPGLGHLTHMPTHIDIRRGRWQEAVVASEKAVSPTAVTANGPKIRAFIAAS